MSLNKCCFIGRLGNDPEIKSMNNGNNVANLSLAISESWKDKNTGEKKEHTEWVRVVIFGKLADIAGDYLKKGSQVYIEGQLKTRKWQKDGVDQYTTEVVIQGFGGVLQMIGGKPDNQQPQAQQQFQHKQARQPQVQQAPADFDTDLPF